MANYSHPGRQHRRRSGPLHPQQERPDLISRATSWTAGWSPTRRASSWPRPAAPGRARGRQTPPSARSPPRPAGRLQGGGGQVRCLQGPRPDRRPHVVQSVIDRKGRIINSQKEVGGWFTASPTAAAKDSDGDGHARRLGKGPRPESEGSSDAAKDRDGDGYTNIEDYVNGLVK
ncbi:hypothetical protein ACRAWD_29600 [Caulobacter segnis]